MAVIDESMDALLAVKPFAAPTTEVVVQSNKRATLYYKGDPLFTVNENGDRWVTVTWHSHYDMDYSILLRRLNRIPGVRATYDIFSEAFNINVNDSRYSFYKDGYFKLNLIQIQ